MTTMMKHKHNGWTARDRYPFGDPADCRFLDISTHKGTGSFHGQIVTRAYVCTVGDGFETHSIGMGTGLGDFSTRVAAVPGTATERAVLRAHVNAIEAYPSILAAAQAHYAAQKAPQ